MMELFRSALRAHLRDPSLALLTRTVTACLATTWITQLITIRASMAVASVLNVIVCRTQDARIARADLARN